MPFGIYILCVSMQQDYVETKLCVIGGEQYRSEILQGLTPLLKELVAMFPERIVELRVTRKDGDTRFVGTDEVVYHSCQQCAL